MNEDWIEWIKRQIAKEHGIDPDDLIIVGGGAAEQKLARGFENAAVQRCHMEIIHWLWTDVVPFAYGFEPAIARGLWTCFLANPKQESMSLHTIKNLTQMAFISYTNTN